MGDDFTRGQALAELARGFLLWLRDHELPGMPQLNKVPLDDLALLAGVYRKVAERRTVFDLAVVSIAEREDARRVVARDRLAVTHLLITSNPNDLRQDSLDRWMPRNSILPIDAVPLSQAPLEDSYALATLVPELDSLKLDGPTLATHLTRDFLTAFVRADLVWDTAKSAPKTFQYRWIFDYEMPREGYRRQAQTIVPPEEIQHPNEAQAQRRYRAFVDYLRQNATYRAATTTADLSADDGDGNLGEGDGTYYAKYCGDPSRAPKSRDFKLGNLSDEYILDSILQPVLQRDTSPDTGYVYVQTRLGWNIYRLSHDARRNDEPFTVTPAWLTFDSKPADIKQTVANATCVFFHALDGANRMPTLPARRKPLHYADISHRYVVDYKEYVRWFYGIDAVHADEDEEWLDLFVDSFFADPVFPISLAGLVPGIHERLIQAARDSVAGTASPLKERLQEMLAEYERQPQCAFLVRGEAINDLQVLGVSYRGDDVHEVFEWNPRTAQVTRMPFLEWLTDIERTKMFNEIYANTRGMIPLMMVMTWGSLGVLGAEIVAPGVLGSLARGAVYNSIVDEGRSRVLDAAKRVALRELATRCAAYLASCLLATLPSAKSWENIFLRSMLRAFSGGGIYHYLVEADERLKRGASTLLKAAVNKLTKGAYRIAMVYQRLSAAVHKLYALYQALQSMRDLRVEFVAEQLKRLGEKVGMGFLIVVFVAVYCDYAYRRKSKTDEWVAQQRDAFVWMVKETGEEIAAYAARLHDETAGKILTDDEVRERDAPLRAKLSDSVRAGVATLPGVAEILASMFKELGVDSWDDLEHVHVRELLSKGIDLFLQAHPDFEEKAAEVLGAAAGELLSGMLLGRRIVPKGIRAASWRGGGHSVPKGIKEALDEGTLRGVWRAVQAVLHALRDELGLLVAHPHGIRDRREDVLRRVDRRQPGYAGFVKDLWRDHENLGKLSIQLVMDHALPEQIRALVEKAKTHAQEMPDIEKLLEVDDPEWPRKAVLFVLNTWLQFGLDQLREAIATVEEQKLFGGNYSLADILEIAGIDVRIDDELVRKIKTKFERTTGK